MITRARDHPHFVGRVEELNAMKSLLPRGLPGDGRLITLAGTMGVGKTRLLTEMATSALTQDLWVVRSFASEMAAPPPLYHWTLILRSLLQTVSGDVREQLLADCDPVLLPLLPELEVESGAKRMYGETAADPLAGRYRLLQAITRLLVDAARSKPLLILLDNLHLADQSSMECLQYFADQLVDHPITVIAAYREDDLHLSNPVRKPLENIARLPHSHALELKGLSREAVAQLMYGMLDRVAPEPIVDAIFSRSDGNPLYVTEVTRALARQGEFSTVSASSLVSRVPSSLRGVIFSAWTNLPNRPATC